MNPERIAQTLLSARIGWAQTLAHPLEEEWTLRGVESRILYPRPNMEW